MILAEQQVGEMEISANAGKDSAFPFTESFTTRFHSKLQKTAKWSVTVYTMKKKTSQQSSCL